MKGKCQVIDSFLKSMADITAIILTKNEEKNITECINSIAPVVKRIVVVDSGSNDKTVELALDLGAEIISHEFINYSKQFLYALDTIKFDTKWILRIDADERLSEKSGKELDALCNDNTDTDVSGIILRFEVEFMGKKLRHGGIYPFKKLLCFKTGIGTIEDRYMDEHIIVSSGRVIEAKEDSYHHDYKDLTYWINKHNWYASREVQDYLESQNNDKTREETRAVSDVKAKIKRWIKYSVYYKLPMGFRARLYYIYRYYFKLGFLDGKEGKIFAVLQAYWYRFLVDAKIYEMEKIKEIK